MAHKLDPMRCKHLWDHIGLVSLGGMEGAIYFCELCPTAEVVLHFPSVEARTKALDPYMLEVAEPEKSTP